MIISESSGTGRTLLRFLALDASGETERCLLSEIIPSWVFNVVVKVSEWWLGEKDKRTSDLRTSERINEWMNEQTDERTNDGTDE